MRRAFLGAGELVASLVPGPEEEEEAEAGPAAPGNAFLAETLQGLPNCCVPRCRLSDPSDLLGGWLSPSSPPPGSP